MAIEDFLWQCPYKKYLGIECLGCGAQTALLHLLQGNFSEAWQIYPAIYPLIFLAFTFVLYLITKRKFFQKMLLPLVVLNVVFIIVQYYWEMIRKIFDVINLCKL